MKRLQIRTSLFAAAMMIMAAVFMSGAMAYAMGGGKFKQNLATEDLAVVTSSGQTHNFTVEVARKPMELAIGLMNRKSMPEGHGMLFLFPDNGQRGFWMKNTLISLDIIFVKQDGTIHKIHARAKPHDETSIMSEGDVPAVLEINGGLAEKLGIQVGDKVFHDFFGNKLAQ